VGKETKGEKKGRRGSCRSGSAGSREKEKRSAPLSQILDTPRTRRNIYLIHLSA
jgi:hypothetical protein